MLVDFVITFQIMLVAFVLILAQVGSASCQPYYVGRLSTLESVCNIVNLIVLCCSPSFIVPEVG